MSAAWLRLARWRRAALYAAGLCALLLACAVGLLASVLHSLRPAPGEWSETVRLGPLQRPLSVPAVLRMATHPFTLALLEGRRLNTRFGPVHWSAASKPGTWRVVCAPCSVSRSELGRERIALPRIEFTLERDLQMKLHGSFALGHEPRALRGRWNARIEPDRAELKFNLPDAPMADAFALFAAAIPELQRAHIEGTIGLTGRLQMPSRELSIKPRISGFSVAGLGTEALLGAVPACGARHPAAALFGAWLPRAVIAAEDQRFYEHPGYDLTEILAAWSSNPRSLHGARNGSSAGQAEPAAAGTDDDVRERARGASTLSQQLAKLIYTGDSPSHVRKLRELLYAVELDRTLGKARVLHLYLAMAPWADGQCGAQAAALNLLGKRAEALTPVEAAWMASLLRNPNAALARMVRTSEVDVKRVAQVIEGMRPMPAARRQAATLALQNWRPGFLGPAPAAREVTSAAENEPVPLPAPTGVPERETEPPALAQANRPMAASAPPAEITDAYDAR